MDPEEKIGSQPPTTPSVPKKGFQKNLREHRRHERPTRSDMAKGKKRCRSVTKLNEQTRRWLSKPPEERAALIAVQKSTDLAKAQATNKRLCGEVASARGELWSEKQAHARRGGEP